MLVKSAPLIRYNASRIGSSPRLRIAFALPGFFTGGGGSFPSLSCCMAASCRRISSS
jgi:hypothetical protein